MARVQIPVGAFSSDEPPNFSEYKEWVAGEYGLDLDHPVFHEPGAPTTPDVFETFEHLFEG